MRIRLIRHATLIIEYAGHRILLDPMLSAAGAMAPIQDSLNPRNNPLVELPFRVEEILLGADAVFITHTHRDHFDDAAAIFLSKSLPIFVQPEDESKLCGLGFADVRVISQNAVWKGIAIHRTGGEHGTGEIGKAMSPVSGFVFTTPGEPVLYIAGDTIWCNIISNVLYEFRPQTIVLNAGGARFLTGDAITMTADDVVDVCQAAPQSRVIAVHMDAINHCLLTRANLRKHLRDIHVNEQVAIPEDGEWL